MDRIQWTESIGLPLVKSEDKFVASLISAVSGLKTHLNMNFWA